MKTITAALVFFTFLICNHLYAQAPDWLWAKSTGGAHSDNPYDMTTDADGNIYVAGNFNSDTILFGNIVLTNPLSNDGDIFIVKYDASGNVLWAKSAGETGEDYPDGIATDANGNIYVTGVFQSASISFGSTTLTNSGAPYEDIFLVKYDPNGNVLWAKNMGGSASDYGHDVTTDASGNVYITGEFKSSSITFGSTTLNNAGGGDFFIAKYSESGNALWAKRAGDDLPDAGYSIVADADGNVFVSGYFISFSISFGSFSLSNPNYIAVFTTKYDSNGNALWAKQSASSNDYHESIDIATDAAGNVFITGLFEGSSISFGGFSLNNADAFNGTADVFLVKYSASGTPLWAKKSGGIGEDWSNGLSVDTDDNIYCSGTFNSQPMTVGSYTLSSVGRDVFIAKYAASGTELWVKKAGGSSDEGGAARTALGPNGELYLSGCFKSTMILGTDTLTSLGIFDFFIAKLENTTTGIFSPVDFSDVATVFPNPTSGEVTIEPQQAETINVQVYNLNGEMVCEVLNVGSSHTSFQVDLSAYPEGLYLIRVNTEKGIISKKLIVAR